MQVEELVGKGLHDAGEGLHEVVHILEDDVHKVKPGVGQGTLLMSNSIVKYVD
jgi:hypothetical protein